MYKDFPTPRAWDRDSAEHRPFPDLSGDQAFRLLAAILEIRDRRSGGQWNPDDAQVACQLAQELLDGTVGGAVASLDASAYPRHREFKASEGLHQRSAVTATLAITPAVFRPGVREALLQALRDLWVGRTVPMLRKEKKRRRGGNPRSLAEAEFLLVHWVYFEFGRGRTKDAARRAVADAVDLSTKSIEAWARKPSNLSYVTFEQAEQAGRLAKAGRVPDEGTPERGFYDEFHATSLVELANRWRAAKSPTP